MFFNLSGSDSFIFSTDVLSTERLSGLVNETDPCALLHEETRLLLR